MGSDRIGKDEKKMLRKKETEYKLKCIVTDSALLMEIAINIVTDLFKIHKSIFLSRPL